MKRVQTILKRPFVLIFASALFSALPYSVPFLFLLSWFSFVPFFVVLTNSENKLRTDIGMSFLFGLLYHLFVYWWFFVLYPMEFAGVSKGVALLIVLLGWIGISLLHGSLFILVGFVAHFSKKLCSRAFCLAVLVASFLVTEWVTELTPLAFPWVRISIGHLRAPVLLQTASVWGVYGTDLLLLSINALICLAILCKAKRRILCFCLAGSVFISNLTYGLIRVYTYRNRKETMRVSIVQGNIYSGDKWGDHGFTVCMDTYCELTEKDCKDSDLIVWPESAIPLNLNSPANRDVVEKLQELSDNCGGAVLLGAFWTMEDKNANAAIMVSEDEVSDPYAKRHLVPFGEAVPYRSFFEKVFPFMTKINMLSDDIYAGKDTALFSLNDEKIGALICFESVFPSLSRDTASDGANLFVIITNDSWYKDSPAVYQHLSHAMLRSIENGRTTVRAANTGVSAIIDPCGVIKEELGPLKQGVIKGEVSYCDDDTLYTMWGNWILPASLISVSLWAVVLCIRNRRRHGDQ